MIIILRPDADKNDSAYDKLIAYLNDLPDIKVRTHQETGTQQVLTELYLVGDTKSLDANTIESFEIVDRVFRVSRE